MKDKDLVEDLVLSIEHENLNSYYLMGVEGAAPAAVVVSTDDRLKPCPRCKKGELMERTGPFGAFIGCTEYFNGCRYTEKVE